MAKHSTNFRNCDQRKVPAKIIIILYINFRFSYADYIETWKNLRRFARTFFQTQALKLGGVSRLSGTFLSLANFKEELPICMQLICTLDFVTWYKTILHFKIYDILYLLYSKYAIMAHFSYAYLVV